MEKVMTLCVVQKDDDILLGYKKKGFGRGLWNGFGGKVKDGETVEQAAKRECIEEAGIIPTIIERRGSLEFTFEGEKTTLLVHVFVVFEFRGMPEETEEMHPQWFSVDFIPYDQMWPDDQYWLPIVLRGGSVAGSFHFTKDNSLLRWSVLKR